MNVTKSIVIALLYTFCNMHAMKNLDDYINQNRNSPKILRDILMHIAKSETPDLNAAKKILDLGLVSINAKDPVTVEEHETILCWTLLTTAASYGKTDYVKLLLDYKADIEITNPSDKRTPLMSAALEGHHETIALLLSRGAKINAQNNSGNTALIWASKYAYVDTVKLLLASGADVTIKNKNGETALDKAKNPFLPEDKDRYDEIIQLLRECK